jgi:hypothetical protein
MITIRLINDGVMSDVDFQTMSKAVQQFVPLVTKAWGIKSVKVEVGGSPVQGDWLVYCTEKNRRLGAAGYHGTLNGYPVAYCSLKASGRIFGTYLRPLIVKGKQIHAAFYTPGLVTTICHEIAEMLCDPNIKTLSATDAQGRAWLVEVCDHVFGFYQLTVVDGKNCILPDVTTPAFYDLKGSAPYSILGGATAPFTLTPKGYAYYMDAKGVLLKVV